MNNVWLADPEDHHFPAAVDYLELLLPAKDAGALVELLKKKRQLLKKQKTF